jgi:hypothetical protein
VSQSEPEPIMMPTRGCLGNDVRSDLDVIVFLEP